MSQMSQARQSRIHGQTLAELNHCVGTARRDAAYACLRELARRRNWPSSRSERALIYSKCLTLVQEVLDTTARSSLMYCNPKQAIWDKPVLHFLRLLQQLLQTLNSLAEHVENVRQEAGVLEEHLGEQTYNLLESTCKDFEHHETVAQVAMRKTLDVGRNLVESNSSKRRELFNEDDKRRYNKAFREYMEHYRNVSDLPRE